MPEPVPEEDQLGTPTEDSVKTAVEDVLPPNKAHPDPFQTHTAPGTEGTGVQPARLAAVPVVFWFSVGISPATMARKAGAVPVAKRAKEVVVDGVIVVGGLPAPPPTRTPFRVSTVDVPKAEVEEK